MHSNNLSQIALPNNVITCTNPDLNVLAIYYVSLDAGFATTKAELDV